MSSPQFFPFFKNPSHFHKFHMWLKTLVPPCPSPHLLKLLCGPAPFLHVSVGYNIILQWLNVFFFSVAFLSKLKPWYWKLPPPSPICLVMWCPAITHPPPPHPAASCQMFFFVRLLNNCVVSIEITPLAPNPPSLVIFPFERMACLCLPPSVSLDGFILFPLNQNKPLSHEITHWSKCGPGLSNQIAEDF